MRDYKAYLFDLDGTLINTIDLILACYRNTLSIVAPELVISDDEIRSHIGLPLRRQLGYYLEALGRPVDYDNVIALHMSYQYEHAADYIQVYDGAVEVFQTLSDKGAHIAIVTSRSRDSAQRYARDFGFTRWCELICTPEDTSAHKPDPEPAIWTLERLGVDAADALFIGDAPFDIGCGTSAGCDTCYVSWGQTPADRLRPAPTMIIDTLRELLP